MIIRLIFILTIFANTALGQSSVNYDILEIVKIGIQDNKLPRQLINNVDSIHGIDSKGQYTKSDPNCCRFIIPVKRTKENGLKQGEYIKLDKLEIWAWGEEDLFSYDVYWITPSNIKIKRDKIAFDFSTHTWFDKKVKYYKGTLKAVKVNGQWVVKNSKLSETKNKFDALRKSKEGNER